MTSEPVTDDAAVYAALRRTWTAADPVPAGMADAMIAAVASADLEREYALLALVHADDLVAVRGDADLLTLQFTDGRTNLLVHVTQGERGSRRLDGWVDGDVAQIVLVEADAADAGHTTAAEDGRFAFDDVAPGIARLRVTLAATADQDGAPDLITPRFEI